jgi:hypothetical protein
MTAIPGSGRPFSEPNMMVAGVIIIGGRPGQGLGIFDACHRCDGVDPWRCFLGGGSVAVGHAPAVTRVERRKLLVTLHAIAATVVVSGEHGGPDGRNRPRGSRLLRHLI